MAQRVRARTAPDGLVVVDKPSGMTSHDVVARVRRLIGTRKVGHAGTLDPLATGVLVLGIERATRLLGHLALTQKAYDATIRLGISTITDDVDGEVASRVDASGVTDEAIHAGVAALTGHILQRPTAVSAIKVDGVRSYARVRAGQDVELPPRPVTVSSFTVHRIRRGPGVHRHAIDQHAIDHHGVDQHGVDQQRVDVAPGSADPGVVDLDVTVVCSSGTYIRALARDLGSGLRVGGHLTRLRRTRVGTFGLDVAVTLEQLADDPTVLPAVEAVRSQFGTVSVDAEQAARVLHGSPLLRKDIPALIPASPIAQHHQVGEPDGSMGPIGLVDPDGVLLSLAQERDGVLTPLVVFS